jgi:uncharacterized membrane protein
MDKEAVFGTITTIFEFVGVSTMCIGILVSGLLAILTWARTRVPKQAFTTLRNSIGLTILLGLEILVAADLVKTVTSSPSLTDAAVLAIIVLIRTVLSISLQIEIEGVAPWKRAFLTSPQLIARAARQTQQQAKQEESTP